MAAGMVALRHLGARQLAVDTSAASAVSTEPRPSRWRPGGRRTIALPFRIDARCDGAIRPAHARRRGRSVLGARLAADPAQRPQGRPVSQSRRLRICYVVPGHRLVSSMGPTRNVLNLAKALQPFADVTVAFRHTAEGSPQPGFPVMEIEPGSAHGRADDAATSGMGNLQFLRYLMQIRRFVQRELVPFDIVLEKSWLLSGYVSALCGARGQLGVPIENIVQNPRHAARGQWLKLLRMKLGARLACRSMRKAPLVIAETEFLRHEIHRHWKVPVERIAVVPLGVDRSLFRPINQSEAR